MNSLIALKTKASAESQSTFTRFRINGCSRVGNNRVSKELHVAGALDSSKQPVSFLTSVETASAGKQQPLFPQRLLGHKENPLISKLHQLADEEFGDLDDFEDSPEPPTQTVKVATGPNRSSIDRELDDYGKQEDSFKISYTVYEWDSGDEKSREKYYSQGDSDSEGKREQVGEEEEEESPYDRDPDGWTEKEEQELFHRVLGDIQTKKNPSVVPEAAEEDEGDSPDLKESGVAIKEPDMASSAVAADELIDPQVENQGLDDEYADEFEDQFELEVTPDDLQEDQQRPGEHSTGVQTGEKGIELEDEGSFDDLEEVEDLVPGDEEQDYEQEDEDDAAIMSRILEREKAYMGSRGRQAELTLEKINLNKLSDREVAAVKRFMDQQYHTLKPGDTGYSYEVERQFDPAEESNEWDKASKSGSLANNSQLVARGRTGSSSASDVVHSQRKVKPSPRKAVGAPSNANKPAPRADEEFDLDFDDDFNDDLDEFDES